MFGVAQILGSIESGKIANLIVTDGDLFDRKTKVKIVFVDGRKYEVRESLRPSEPPKGDLTGKWKLSFTTPQGQEEATADLAMQPDGTLTASVTGDPVTRTVFTRWATRYTFRFP